MLRLGTGLTEKTATDNKTVHIRTYHLLSIASHHTLARYEVFCSEDCRRSLERYVRSVHISAFKERITTTTNKNYLAWEVRINDNVEFTVEVTNLHSTNFTTFSVGGNISTESSSEFKDVGNFRGTNNKVCATTKGLTMDLSGNIIDGFDQEFRTIR